MKKSDEYDDYWDCDDEDIAVELDQLLPYIKGLVAVCHIFKMQTAESPATASHRIGHMINDAMRTASKNGEKTLSVTMRLEEWQLVVHGFVSAFVATEDFMQANSGISPEKRQGILDEVVARIPAYQMGKDGNVDIVLD